MRAFSLIELSIVLVVLGLITGGILAGQSLIRAAQLRSVLTEEQRYVTATQSFRNQYMALPGDMNKATSFWGASSSGCDDGGHLSSAGGTCNGNNDGMITWCTEGVTYNCKEIFWYWMHLGLAGLIEGKYSGAGLYTEIDAVADTNVPKSKISNGYWNVDYKKLDGYVSSFYYSIDYGNYLYLMPGALKAEEAWSIDKKVDDGKPGTGKVIGVVSTFSIMGSAWGANKCTTSTQSEDFNGEYNLANTTQMCPLAFIKLF